MKTKVSFSGFSPVSHEEMLLVSGGAFWGRVWNGIKSAAGWVKDHVYVDLKNNAGGIKGKF